MAAGHMAKTRRRKRDAPVEGPKPTAADYFRWVFSHPAYQPGDTPPTQLTFAEFTNSSD